MVRHEAAQKMRERPIKADVQALALNHLKLQW